MRAWLVVLVACGHPSSPPATPSNRPAAPVVTPAAAVDALLPWPVARITKAQAAEVRDCKIEKLAADRYPKAMAIDALPGAFGAQTACDQAALAAACATRLHDADPPPACLAAYRAAVKANPAFAFASELTGPYFGRVALVAPPTTARLTSVEIVYTWSGLGDAVQWTLTARDLATKPTLSVTGKSGAKWTADVGAAIGSLGVSLTSLLPIPKPLKAIGCTDNYPEWTAKLGFDDGKTLELTTEGSNLLGLGGPWQTTIGGIVYMQLSPDFVRAIANLVKALDLPIGEPMGQMCHGYDLQAEVLGR